jgi:selenocysteine lyase/cysteine desulfurase
MRFSSADSAATDAPLPLVETPDQTAEINLDYAATTPALRATVEAVTEFLPSYGSVHRGGGRRSALATEAYESARQRVAEFVGCSAEHSVIFVRNTTEAANVLAAALPPGSRVLCSPFEHHANLLPWRLHDVRYLPFVSSEAELLTAVSAELQRAQAAREPYDLFAISGASNVTGDVPPVAELAQIVHAHGATIFVDAAQLVPHRQVDVSALDVDFLAFSAHKLYAPFGTGALIVRTEALRDGLPLLRGGGAVRLVSLEDVAWSDVPHRFEAGTPNIIGAIALGAACQALASHGMDRIALAERELATLLWDGLADVPGIRSLRMWETTSDRVGVATFTVDGHEPHEVARTLADEWGIAVRSGAFCAHPLVAHLLGVPPADTRALFEELAQGDDVAVPGAVRASIGLGVTAGDIEAFLRAITAISTGG